MKTCVASRLILTAAVCLALQPATPVRADEAVADRGFTLQVRMPVTSVSSVLNGVLGVPQFTMGWKLGGVMVGLGLGASRVTYRDTREYQPYRYQDEIHGTLFQVAPTAAFQFWQSADGSTVGNVSLAGQYGRARLTQTAETSDPTMPATAESRIDGHLFGFHLALGADHHLDPHFALGVEAGVQGVFGSDLSADTNPDQTIAFSSSLAYGALRATVVF